MILKFVSENEMFFNIAAKLTALSGVTVLLVLAELVLESGLCPSSLQRLNKIEIIRGIYNRIDCY
jgi:hypothetical protein